MKFPTSLFRGLLIFYTYDSANFKSIGNNTTKNATRYCAGSAYYRMRSTDVYCSKQTGSSSTKGTIITHHFSLFLELGRRKLSMQPKFVAAQKMLLKQKPINIRVRIACFITLGITFHKGVYCFILIVTVAHRYGNPICTAH